MATVNQIETQCLPIPPFHISKRGYHVSNVSYSYIRAYKDFKSSADMKREFSASPKIYGYARLDKCYTARLYS